MRKEFLLGSLVLFILYILSWVYWKPGLWTLIVIGPIWAVGWHDFFQTKQAIKRNFPVLGNFRYIFEAIRPEISQYFIETNTSGMPLSREERSIVYQRAKQELATLPFGTQRDVYEPGYEWLKHSMNPTHVDPKTLRINIGGPECKQPYSASIFNISAMSYGSLSSRAVLALNGGAKDGNFAHNTGEGGLSPYHLEPGGDLIWQIGTGYFGCRTLEGEFDRECFKGNALKPQVKMIEIKLSQGAKPGHGGILPKEKVTEEISKIRNVPMGKDVISPPGHTSFSTPVGLMEFVKELRDLSGGKPVGFKLCIGKRYEFIALCKAMLKTGITPDFITIDGGEGGTGAAPLEFSNRLGTPGTEGLIFAHNALVGFKLRDKIKIISTGKVTNGFGIIRLIAIGADAVYSARAMMLAIGCIQALRCNSNHCPTGVATQDPELERGLVVDHKRKRVANYHTNTIHSVAEMLGAMGVPHTDRLEARHVVRRISETSSDDLWDIYDYLEPGVLLGDSPPEAFKYALDAASADTFINQVREEAA